mgnify:CR=1 FL=1
MQKPSLFYEVTLFHVSILIKIMYTTDRLLIEN